MISVNGDSTKPDILVAVDLGTTYTGVGWARPQFSNALQSPIQIIYNWPGCSTKNEQKAHTCLVYRGDGQLSSWGFLCEDDDGPDRQRKEFFKIFLDRATLQDARRQGISAAPATTQDAQALVADYLRQVYQHVKQTIELQTGVGSYPGWGNMAVEFHFSVPTTWRSQEIINTFKETIRSAGFGTEGPRHQATVELTESEAAAVATIKSSTISFRKGDIFLSVDAGGGTTDFAVMQVVDNAVPFPALAQITQVDGVGIGSTLIDRAFLALVTQRLCAFPQLLQQLPPDCVDKLARSERYKTMKHRFGEQVYESDVYRLPMDGVGYNFNHPQAGIEGGRMLFTRAEIQSLFDPHIDSMLIKIREQLDWTQANTYGQQVSYVILSGGLGSSAYVRQRLQQELTTNRHPCGVNISILQASDPQLVVVKGLLLDRMQKLDTGSQPVLVRRKARSSYGVVCKTLFNPAIHAGEEIRRDPLDGQDYAMGQIDWIIKKGDIVDPENPISSKFSQKIDPSSPNRTWDFIVMNSHNDRNDLPRSTRNGATQLCTVKSDLTGVQDAELILRRQAARSCLSRGKKFFICNFEVKAIVAPADLRFELWFNGHRFSGNHEPIKVTWDQDGTQAGS